jgi:pyruvate formate lyase activating enzyme
MDIKGFIPTSLIEWEGRLASVLFLPGCNLRCHYCHAGQLICNPDRLDTVPREQVFAHLRRQRNWLDGVVITGGEPTLHGEALRGLIDQIRAIPLDVMIETNGTRPEWVGRLIAEGALAAVAMDVKAPLTAIDYSRVAGVEVDVNDVRHTLCLIKDSGLPHEFRITVVPGLIGLDEIGRMAPDLDGADTIAVQNVKPALCLEPALRKVTPYAPEELDAMAEVLRPHARRVVVRGRDAAALAASKANAS